MSENMKSRQNRVRRNVTALVSAVALACGTVAVPQVAPTARALESGPIIDIDAREADGKVLKMDVQLTVDNANPTGDFKYIVKAESRPPRPTPRPDTPGESNLRNFVLWLHPDDAKTEIDESAQPEFVWASGNSRPYTAQKLDNGEWRFEFGDEKVDPKTNESYKEVAGGDYLVEARIPARVKEGAQRPFHAKAVAESEIRPPIGWVGLRENLQWEPTDEGLIFYNSSKDPSSPGYRRRDPHYAELWNTYQLQGGGYGSQLFQFFLGLQSKPGGADLKFVGGTPRNPETGGDDTQRIQGLGFWVGDGLAVRVTDPDGKFISDEVMKRMRPAQPPFQMLEPHTPKDPSNPPKFISGWNWFEGQPKPDGEITDDELWLPSGTTIEIHQLVYDPDARFGKLIDGPDGTRIPDVPGDVASHIVDGRPGQSARDEDEITFGSPFIGDRVWVDTNGNGIQDDGETTGVPGVRVIVSRDGEPDRAVTTDSDGKWLVEGLTADAQYNVRFILPTDGDYKDYVATTTGAENSTPANDSNGLEFTTGNIPAAGDLTYDLGIKEPGKASVGDRVWVDANRNGLQNQGENGLTGVTVTVTPPQGSTEQTRTVTTDTNGKWKVEGLTPGVEYTVEFTLPDGYKATQARVGDDQGKDSNGLKSTVTLNPGEFNQTYDLGVYQTAFIGDYVWEDLNNDGIQQGNEPPITGVVVKVEGPNGETFYTSTNNEGKWLVDDLVPGTDYTVTFTPPTGYAPTKTAQGEDRAVDSNGLTFKTGEVPAEGDLTLDLGLVKTASVGDRVWLDEGEGSNRGNGIQDDGEPNVPGVKVTVSAEGEDDRSTVTDPNGNWRIDGLTPGVKYTVTFTPPAGYEVTKTNQGDDRGTDSNEATSTVTLKPGEYNKTYDLGLVKKLDPATASVGDRVWVDENANGIQDDDEKNGVSGVTVTVTPPEGNSEEPRTTTTDDNGNWRIDGLTPGLEYTVTFKLPDGTTVTKTVKNNPEKDSNGLESTVTLEPGEYNDTYDLGVVSASVGDRVWLDEGKDANKANGIQDADETTGVAGVVVRVSRQGEAVRETKTNDNGEWKIDGLTPGVNYRVEFDAPAGYSVSPSKQGKDGEKDSNGLSDTIAALESGENNTSYDLGLYKPAPTTTVSTTTAAPTTTPTTTVTTQVPTTVTTKVTTEKQVPTTVTTQVPTTVTTAGNCKTCTPTTVTTQVPTTVPTTLIRTTEVEVTKEVPTTVVQTTTNKVVVTDENTAIIGDKVYIDDNSDGKQDPNENEGVPNVTVIVTGEDGEEQRTVTDKDGNWHVVVQPGEYTVKYETDRVPSDPEQLERTATVKPGEKKDDVDLGVLRTGTVGDRVWNDEDGDGEQGENEKGLENVVVLVSREGEPTRSAVTDENGDWKIEGLNPNAEYEIRFIKPEGWEVTGKVPGSDESGLVSKVTVKPNEYNDTYDLGLKKIDPDCDCEPEEPGRIGDRVWVDENGDGKQDPGEKTGVPDVTVIVRDKDGNEVTRTVTDENGNWKVDVTPGDYEVEYRPRDWKPTDPSQVIRKVTVESGKEYLDLDLGVKPGEPAPSTPPVTVTQTVEKPAPSTTPKPWSPGLGEGGEFLDRCVANAVRSPFLYLVPVALLGAFGGELARPYMGAINEQVNKINAEFQAAIRRNSPEWGEGGQGARREDPFAQLRGQIDAANRQLQQMAADPDVQRFGTVAAGIIGLIAAGAVIYDWCSSEEGQAVTSIKGDGSSRQEKVTTVAPTVTTTETRN